MKKVLIITYYWPPSGGSGVQRWLKFSKYLPEFGIEPIILTVDPEYATFPGSDFTLEKEIHPSITVYKTRAKNPLELYQKIRNKPAPQSGFSGEKKKGVLDKIFRFIRGNVFLPDARIGWNPYAYSKAKELIKKHGIETVIITSPPHSSQLIGLRLKKEFSIQLIADLRDPWTEIFYNKELFRTKWAERQDANMEKLCLENADQIVVVSDAIKRSFSAKYPVIQNNIVVIPNGFDEADFSMEKSVVLSEIPSKEKVISYVGNLGEQYPIDGFLQAFSNLVNNEKEWKLRFVGNCHVGVKNKVENLNLTKQVEFIPYVDHAAAIQFMLTSTILLLIIPEVEDNKGILTGKLFEYLATRNPILLIGPADGDAAKIVNEHAFSAVVDSHESEKMYNFMLLASTHINKEQDNSMLKYTRKNLAKEFVQLIRA